MKLFISCVLGLLFSAQAHAQLLIAPTRFVLDADTSVTEKIVVENNSDQPIRLEIKPIYRPIKATGLVRTDANVTESENIANWIKVSPPIIRELKPNQRRTVRLRMNALPDDMPDGEYRAYLWFLLSQRRKSYLNWICRLRANPIMGQHSSLTFT